MQVERTWKQTKAFQYLCGPGGTEEGQRLCRELSVVALFYDEFPFAAAAGAGSDVAVACLFFRGRCKVGSLCAMVCRRSEICKEY